MGPRGRGVLGRLLGGAGPATPLARVAARARGVRRRGGSAGRARGAAAPAGARGRGEPGHAGAGGPVRRRQRRRHRRGGRRAARRAARRALARGSAAGRHPRLAARARGGTAAARAPVTPKIAVLPPQVADQIAAGEVVERPASVVKELVENALDAGARTVRVTIENGGKTLIRVSDDGEGMSREDAELALGRHATSKIRGVADLIGVGTFGFRGEALPAIASVSRFELETSSDGRGGARVRLVGGEGTAVEDAVRQRGTTVTVRALFFNTPARRKFLRAQQTETRAVVEALTVLALARPDVAFALESDDRALLDVGPAARPIDRVHELWGRELADTLLPIGHREGPLEVRGFAQRPAQAKPAGRKGYVLVRGRPIRDPFILRAAEAGYRSTIAPGDRPTLILFLDLPGDAVDVNVHPTQLEVRFRDKVFVERVVEEAVREALAPLTAAVPLGVGGDTAGVGFQMPGVGGFSSTLEIFPGESLTPDTRHLIPPLLQVFDTYILFQTDTAVAIVDQHSAHERVLYETVMRQLSGDGASAQRLLLPLTLDFSAAELEAVDAHGELLRRVGYEIEPFSGRSVVVHGAQPASTVRRDALPAEIGRASCRERV